MTERLRDTYLGEVLVPAVAAELSAHPEIGTTEAKIDFIQEEACFTYNELAEILPSAENGEIDPGLLDLNFFFISFLARKLKPGVLSQVIRRPAPKYEGSTLLDVMQQGYTDLVFSGYLRTFEWEHLG